jgi:hypothetical protein
MRPCRTVWPQSKFPSELVDDLSYHADLTGGQPGNEPAFMPAYEAARSRSARNRPRFDIMVSDMTRPVQG